MRKSQLLGIGLITAAAALFAALAYEPANIVALFGLQNLVSEAAVVVLTLAVVAACGIGGIATLWRGRTVSAS